MTKRNQNIHVLADETLGGIKREYVEVNRKAEVGEKIVIVDRYDREVGYENGAIFTVDRDDFLTVNEHVESDAAKSVDNIHGFILREEYHVLEPTDIVHIDGPDGTTQRYVLTDRKAEVGEKVIVTEKGAHLYPIGTITEIEKINERRSTQTRKGNLDLCGWLLEREYGVLVPLDKRNKTFENKNSGYKEIKNLIHNDLGITRLDIQEMISVAVCNEVQKMSESGKLESIAGAKIESLIEEGFRDGGRLLYGFKERVSETVSDEIGKRIANVLNINVELKGERN
ncbi:hypothetical protein [Bacillus atrophaeus]|uniref:hypothetical protein n=1 Tax=Bacillus atrophaeus TaxID=1452 RepID=UPI002DBD80A4|nr:hypothetical protein [Bacillus atrophaeus]MEC2307688.1 hypothetical protein [Bacillus atrophaeus]